MQRWEYKIIKRRQLTESDLNDLGGEGWELITMDFHTSHYVFKRLL